VSVFVQVVFPLPLGQPFTYEVHESLRDKARPGARVLAPLGRKKQAGFIVSAGSAPPGPGIRTKEILEVLDDRPFWDERFLSFTRDLSAEYHSSWGEMLQASLPPSLALKKKVTARLTDLGRATLDGKKLGARECALAVLLAQGPKGRSPLFLQRKAGLKSVSSLLARMARKGLVAVTETAVAPPRAPGAARGAGAFQLPLEFAASRTPGDVLGPVERAIDEHRFGSFYLFGSRLSLDSAYAGLIRRAAARSERTLLLVPEMALSEVLIRRLETDLGRPAAVFHGRITEKQKESAWRDLRSGRTTLVVGTRSALFLDTGPLRLVVVDNEHEESYIQPESPAYDARRGAWLRARSEGAVVVFGSPRPSVEAYYQAARNGALLELGPAPARADITWVDRRAEAPVLSRELELKIRENLRRDEPVLLFLNRRGYAASLACEACGRVPRCRRCDIPLVYHKREETLVCHYCNASTRAGTTCSVCGGRLAARKGAGTQALEEELKAFFPRVPVARFDADTAGLREEREKILRGFSAGRIPLLVGTQLLAHQPGIPRVRLVGIISPETLLGFSDYGAGQKTFQAVSRMLEFCEPGAGSEAVIQTRAPAHYSIQAAAAGDFMAFYEREIEFRRVMNYPPLAALAEVTLQGRDVRALAARSREFGALLRRYEPEIEILGPALASIVRVRDVSRVQIILKAARRETIDRALDESLPRIRLKKAVVFSYSPFGPA
jgi:primosomal protein N' (replication factor Y)